MGESWQGSVLSSLLRIRKRIVRSWRVSELDLTSAMETLGRLFGPLGRTTSLSVAVEGIPGEWIAPRGCSTDGIILYLHGGAYVSGSIASRRSLAASIALAAATNVLLIDYRLAPRHPYPAALDDAVAAYRWLVNTGCTPSKLALAGDSAGGGLVAGLLMRLRDGGEVLPASAVCLSPWMDLTCAGESWTTNAQSDLLLDRGGLLNAARLYMVDADPRAPYASPIFGDLRGLPSMLLQVGSEELLLSDSMQFGQRAREVGTEVTTEVWKGMQHVWQFAARVLPEGNQAVKRIGNFISEAFV